VGLEYSRVDSYTYLRDNFAEVYANFDQPLGSRLGPDADLWRARSEAWPTGLIRLAASVGRWRRGALRLGQRPARGAFGHAGEPFPSVGTGGLAAQETWLASGSARLLYAVLPVEGRVDAARVRNVNNTPSGAATYMRAQFVVTYRFRYP